MTSQDILNGDWTITHSQAQMISVGDEIAIAGDQVTIVSPGASGESNLGSMTFQAADDSDSGYVEFPLVAGPQQERYGAIRIFSYQNEDGGVGIYGFIDVSDPQQVGVFGSNASGGGEVAEAEPVQPMVDVDDYAGTYLLTTQNPVSMVWSTTMVIEDGKITFYYPNGEQSAAYELTAGSGVLTYHDDVNLNVLSLYAEGNYRALCCAQLGADTLEGVWAAQIASSALLEIPISEITATLTVGGALSAVTLYLGIAGREFCLEFEGTVDSGENSYTFNGNSSAYSNPEKPQLTVGDLEGFPVYLRLYSASYDLSLTKVEATVTAGQETYQYARLGDGQTITLSINYGERLGLLPSGLNRLSTQT